MAPKVSSCYRLWTFHTSSLLLLEPSTPSIMDLFQRLPLIGRNMGPRTGYIAWPPNDTFREDRSNKATCWSEPQQGHHWTGKPIKSSTSSGSDWTRWECRLTRPITGMMDGSGLFFLFVILLFWRENPLFFHPLHERTDYEYMVMHPSQNIYMFFSLHQHLFPFLRLVEKYL